jgi:hypothetical protein
MELSTGSLESKKFIEGEESIALSPELPEIDELLFKGLLQVLLHHNKSMLPFDLNFGISLDEITDLISKSDDPYKYLYKFISQYYNQACSIQGIPIISIGAVVYKIKLWHKAKTGNYNKKGPTPHPSYITSNKRTKVKKWANHSKKTKII